MGHFGSLLGHSPQYGLDGPVSKQMATKVDMEIIRGLGVDPLNNDVFRNQECHNRPFRLDIWVCSSDMVWTTMCPQRIIRVVMKIIHCHGGFPEQSCVQGSGVP